MSEVRPSIIWKVDVRGFDASDKGIDGHSDWQQEG